MPESLTSVPVGFEPIEDAAASLTRLPAGFEPIEDDDPAQQIIEFGKGVADTGTAGRIYTLGEIKSMGVANLKTGMKARGRDGNVYVWDGREFQPAKD